MSENPEDPFSSSKYDDEQKDSYQSEATSSQGTNASTEDEAESCNSHILNMMDINEIIGVQPDYMGESTLESEIDALSKVIDAKDPLDSNEQLKVGKDQVDLDSNILYESTDIKKSEKIYEEERVRSTGERAHGENICFGIKNISRKDVIESESSVSNQKKAISDLLSNDVGKAVILDPCINTSLLSIGEAYNSEESENSSDSNSTGKIKIPEGTGKNSCIDQIIEIKNVVPDHVIIEKDSSNVQSFSEKIDEKFTPIQDSYAQITNNDVIDANINPKEIKCDSSANETNMSSNAHIHNELNKFQGEEEPIMEQNKLDENELSLNSENDEKITSNENVKSNIQCQNIPAQSERISETVTSPPVNINIEINEVEFVGSQLLEAQEDPLTNDDNTSDIPKKDGLHLKENPNPLEYHVIDEVKINYQSEKLNDSSSEQTQRAPSEIPKSADSVCKSGNSEAIDVEINSTVESNSKSSVSVDKLPENEHNPAKNIAIIGDNYTSNEILNSNSSDVSEIKKIVEEKVEIKHHENRLNTPNLGEQTKSMLTERDLINEENTSSLQNVIETETFIETTIAHKVAPITRQEMKDIETKLVDGVEENINTKLDNRVEDIKSRQDDNDIKMTQEFEPTKEIEPSDKEISSLDNRIHDPKFRHLEKDEDDSKIIETFEDTKVIESLDKRNIDHNSIIQNDSSVEQDIPKPIIGDILTSCTDSVSQSNRESTDIIDYDYQMISSSHNEDCTLKANKSKEEVKTVEDESEVINELEYSIEEPKVSNIQVMDSESSEVESESTVEDRKNLTDQGPSSFHDPLSEISLATNVLKTKIETINDSSSIHCHSYKTSKDEKDYFTPYTDSIDVTEAEIISEAEKLEKEKLEQPPPIDIQNIGDSEKSISNDTILEEKILISNKIDYPESLIIKKNENLEIKQPSIDDVPFQPKSSIEESNPLHPTSTGHQKNMLDDSFKIEDSDLNIPKDFESSVIDSDSKTCDIKEIEKLESENLGSPRIILKIAKSALTECAEPRSPKSPKIRSAANSPNPEECQNQKLGKIKLKLSKSGHPSIISSELMEDNEQRHPDSTHSAKIKRLKHGDQSMTKEKHELAEEKDRLHKLEDKKSESLIGMKIKLSKTGDASIVQKEIIHDSSKNIDSPSIGMKFKLSKTGDASIIPQNTTFSQDDKKNEKIEDSDRPEKEIIQESLKLKFVKSSSTIYEQIHKKDTEQKDKSENIYSTDSARRLDSPGGFKIKFNKAKMNNSVPTDNLDDTIEKSSPKRTESPIGVKIKFSKSGDPSIVQSDIPEIDHFAETSDEHYEKFDPDSYIFQDARKNDPSIGMKIKLNKDGDASIVHSEKLHGKFSEQNKKQEIPIGMKIKIPKTGDPSIIQTDVPRDSKESKIKIPKSHTSILGKMNEELQGFPLSLKRHADISISLVETKKHKPDINFKQKYPQTIIQPVATSTKKFLSDPKYRNISQQQLNVINEEISITQVRSSVPKEDVFSCELKNAQQFKDSPSSSDCEIIEPVTECIGVNENSNSSQEVMIIEEVPAQTFVKVPKKRGRPRKTDAPVQNQKPRNPVKSHITVDVPKLSQVSHSFSTGNPSLKETERPKRTCRSQKSYAPTKRGRGGRGGRGKRKTDFSDSTDFKRSKVEQDLTAMEQLATARILPEIPKVTIVPLTKVPEALTTMIKLKNPLKESSLMEATSTEEEKILSIESEPMSSQIEFEQNVSAIVMESSDNSFCEQNQFDKETKLNIVETKESIDDSIENKDSSLETSMENKISTIQEPQNWLAPPVKKIPESMKSESAVSITVLDEETRMSADSNSRSQTPARNLVPTVTETILNEESQGSVLSTATTESEKVKVRNRRMEINFDPDEGPFTVEKIAEYEWPQDKKDERFAVKDTFMIQEQISQYLGVKSFKRKYPDLKRRMVDMEERNYLRENGLVSESMCDMGLTAICSAEVLDIMCSDFPEQYEEYRKYLREKQAKEHSKKQKELSAAANAERNRIDLAEMAMQSALTWNSNLNKTRKDSRCCSLDLQSFTVHMPRKPQKVIERKVVNQYPVALIPGQYTDYYREYTPQELRYYPLNTVLYGPMRPNERKFDSQSEGSQSDSDSELSSDDSSSSSSEGTQNTEESRSTMEDIEAELASQRDLKCKLCSKNLNKSNLAELLIQCGTCHGFVHPSCIDITPDMVPHIRSYAWQCTDCKTCAQCHDPADEDKMLFCDFCDRGYHIYCVGLRRVPQGRWHCQECAVCSSCGTKDPAGDVIDKSVAAQWHHEYKKGDKNNRVFVSTFCVPCSKMRGS